MILGVDIAEKTIGAKELFRGLEFRLELGEKVAIIGRNGVGKTTLFNMLAGNDKIFIGEVKGRRGLRIAATKQEFHGTGEVTCYDYILDNIPEFRVLQKIIDAYPESKDHSQKNIAAYTDALERFSQLDYFSIKDRVFNALAVYQIGPEAALQRFKNLSGGQKRFADLVRVELSYSDLALVDEPTNHMDYVGKAAFINWLNDSSHAVAVITHDRDVLANVDRIIEIKDKKAYSFNGNYHEYLRLNNSSTVDKITDYETGQRTLDNLYKQLIAAKTKKLNASSDSAKKFRIMEDRLQRQYDDLKAQVSRPDFWIDQENVAMMPGKVSEKYHKYKSKNIRILGHQGIDSIHELLRINGLSLGYDHPLFDYVSCNVSSGSQIQIKGRNGAGKTTLVRAIIAASTSETPPSTTFAGEILPHKKIKVGFYEQEISEHYLRLTLADAIKQTYHDKDVPINDQKVKQIMADYLFDPQIDGRLRVEQLSGGQKARLQIIKMLCNKPNLLILDEPTNHLDLPSVEELENALTKYDGAIIFVSHDTFFAKNFDAEVIQIGEQ